MINKEITTIPVLSYYFLLRSLDTKRTKIDEHA